MMLIRSFFRRITKDLKQKELLPLKLIFFVQASTLYVLYPYLTIHMRELGINVEETAIMSAITPFVAIVMPPLAGLVADRIGNFKILLSLISSLGGAAALLLLLVPVGRVTVKYPELVELNLGCSESNGNMMYTLSQTNHHCDTNLQDEVMTRVESCGFECHVDNQTDVQLMLSSRSYAVKYFDPILDHDYVFKYNRPRADFMQTAMTENDIKEHRLLRNNGFYKTSIRQLSKDTFFFPSGQLYEFSCDKSDEENTTFCEFGEFILPFQNESNRKDLLFKSKLKQLAFNSQDDSQENPRFFVEEIMLKNDEFKPVTCTIANKTSGISITVSIINSTSDSEPEDFKKIDKCVERCIVTIPRRNMCSNIEIVKEYNIQLTFWLYLSIRVFIGIIGGTAFAMFEGAVIAILREQNADYGLQRIYGSIGGMISSPLSGMLIDYASQGKEYTDFRPAFYLYAALKMASGVLMLAINLEFKSPAHNVVGDVISVLKNIEISALMIACFMLGTAWGYIESFLFWLLQDLGGSRSLMGITVTVGGVAGIPLLVLSGPLINKIGHANVLVVGFVFYAVRLLGYSVIYNPWHCLIFEALESVTSSLSFTAAVTYAAKLSSTTTDSSIQGLLGGLYYGVGKGTGSLVGGFLMKAFGTRPTYQIFAVASIITGLVYFLFNSLYLRKRPQVEGNDIVKKKSKKPVENGIESAIDLDENIKNRKENSATESYNGEVNMAFDDTNLESIERQSEMPRINSVDEKIEQPKGATNPSPVPENECGIAVEREATQEVNESH